MSHRFRMALLLAATVVVAACKPGAPTAATPAVATPPVATAPSAPVNPDPKVTEYRCADGEALSAGYPDPNTAVVTWKGHAYNLKIARSASGARYTGMGLQWWTKGLGRGTLSALKSGEDVASDPGVVCLADTGPEVSPPAPGSPGGLPDDRTPISEAPFTPQSAQGAANVVQTYFAFVESGREQEATALRSDGAIFDVKPYRTFAAQVGAPGQIEGAAGSLYVEVPVVAYGRLEAGGEFSKAGRVILRRSNDVPGSSPAQRRWRISWIDWKS